MRQEPTKIGTTVRFFSALNYSWARRGFGAFCSPRWVCSTSLLFVFCSISLVRLDPGSQDLHFMFPWCLFGERGWKASDEMKWVRRLAGPFLSNFIPNSAVSALSWHLSFYLFTDIDLFLSAINLSPSADMYKQDVCQCSFSQQRLHRETVQWQRGK